MIAILVQYRSIQCLFKMLVITFFDTCSVLNGYSQKEAMVLM